MHTEARRWVQNFATDQPLRVIEIGSLNVNGTIRNLFPHAEWTGLDRQSGPGVDWTGDAVDYEPAIPVDMVVCCEVLEHADNWQNLIQSTFQWLVPGGVCVITCAGLGREPHSCDGGPLKDGEYYRNLDPSELRHQLTWAGFRWHYVRQFQTDVQAFAVR